MDGRPLAMPQELPRWGDVVLREFDEADVAMVMDLATDPYVPTIGSLPFAANRPDALAYVNRQRGRTMERVGWSFCVADAVSNAALGGAGLWFDHVDPHRMTAGYSVAPRARGRGVAGRALRALTAFAWTLHAVQRIELFIEPWNTASLRTAEHAGYVREVLLHDQELQDRRVDFVRLAATRPPRT